MRLLIGAIVAGAMLLPAIATAQVRVRGYVRSDGTYVAPSVRSAPNSSRYDNWSTAPNVNPYNGRSGTVDPYKAPTVPTWQPYRAKRY